MTVPVNFEHAVRLEVQHIHQAVERGPSRADSKGAQRIMVAFATCDRQKWIPDEEGGSVTLWQLLDEAHRTAIGRYLGGEKKRPY